MGGKGKEQVFKGVASAVPDNRSKVRVLGEKERKLKKYIQKQK